MPRNAKIKKTALKLVSLVLLLVDLVCEHDEALPAPPVRGLFLATRDGVTLVMNDGDQRFHSFEGKVSDEVD